MISGVLLGVVISISSSLLPSVSAYQSNGGTEIKTFLNKVSRVGFVVTGPLFALVGLN
jgi:O-antigen/teichoic acid export membrane protein